MQGREFHNLIAIGTLCEISQDGTKARVRLGDIKTDFRPLPAFYGRNFTAALTFRLNSQVVLSCPSGNLDNAIIIGCLWTGDVQPFETQTHIDGIEFEDGTRVQYDSDEKALSIDCAGKVIINAAADIAITGNANIAIAADGNLSVSAAGNLALSGAAVSIDGPVTQTGGDMTSDGKSVQTHKHAETGSVTQAPQ